jgi:hypothetical protein
MKYQIQSFEQVIESKDYPHLTPVQFDQLVGKNTQDFVIQMAKLNAQFVAQQDMSHLCNTSFFAVNGTMAIRRLHTYDAQNRNHFVMLEAQALIEAQDIDQPLPGEKPLNEQTTTSTVLEQKAH